VQSLALIENVSAINPAPSSPWAAKLERAEQKEQQDKLRDQWVTTQKDRDVHLGPVYALFIMLTILGLFAIAYLALR
jgi:hypothetical protein